MLRPSALVAAVAAGALVLVGCGSDQAEVAVTETTTEVAVTETTEEVVVEEPLDAAGLACASFFEIDVLMLGYAGGMVEDGEMTEAQVKREYRRLIDEVVSQGEIAVAEGQIEPKIVNNAKRLQKAANGMKKKDTFANMPKKQRDLMETRMTRIERTCARAGYDLPEENALLRADTATS